MFGLKCCSKRWYGPTSGQYVNDVCPPPPPYSKVLGNSEKTTQMPIGDYFVAKNVQKLTEYHKTHTLVKSPVVSLILTLSAL